MQRAPFPPSLHLSSRFSSSLNGTAAAAAARGTFGYFTFNFVSSALTALRRLRKLRKPPSGVRSAGGEERRVGRESRVEIIAATLIIYLLPR